MSYIFEINNLMENKSTSSAQSLLLSIVNDDIKQANFWLVSLNINLRTFLSKIMVHISSQDRNICETITLPHKLKNGGHFQNKGHIYRHASNEQNVNFPLLIYFNRSVMFLILLKYALCLFVYNVYFLCRYMKVYLVRHFICLKTKMTEFRVVSFHIDFFPRQMKETYFKGVKQCAKSQ